MIDLVEYTGVLPMKPQGEFDGDLIVRLNHREETRSTLNAIANLLEDRTNNEIISWVGLDVLLSLSALLCLYVEEVEQKTKDVIYHCCLDYNKGVQARELGLFFCAVTPKNTMESMTEQYIMPYLSGESDKAAARPFSYRFFINNEQYMTKSLLTDFSVLRDCMSVLQNIQAPTLSGDALLNLKDKYFSSSGVAQEGSDFYLFRILWDIVEYNTAKSGRR